MSVKRAKQSVSSPMPPEEVRGEGRSMETPPIVQQAGAQTYDSFVRNLKYMRKFVQEWTDRAIVQQLVAQIPWGHSCVLVDRLKDAETREFYIRKTFENRSSLK